MAMKGCLSVTKYFLFVFNLFFFILGGVLLCFGLWILFDRSSFASMIGSSTPTLKIWSYVLSGVGILTMLLGFLGCLGSLKEIKCLLGFLNLAVGKYVENIIKNYGIFTNQTELQEGLDFAQEQMSCCGWFAPEDWMKNLKIHENSSVNLYPCSCRNTSYFLPYPNINGTANDTDISEALPEHRSGFCTAPARDNWPVYKTGCMNSIQTFIINNLICIIGVCIGIALLELFVMTLSMCLCRNLDQNYNKLARYS
ncbi:leukocyte antigen CD37-like isoform X2 [Bufo bufo]|uniref:leukocyte antigen CD37-like isoform X2 n=1 Tax=Bufo bufo TaxID=8384 RepID=UPI001ABE23F9|nr:leukocyte antigen CD37-like isoform X2 [Bufo bufo]